MKLSFPCYEDKGKNIASIVVTKNYVGIWFFQGGLLKDKNQVLTNAQKGKTKAMRQWRIESLEELNLKRIEAYIYEAIDNQRAGREIKADRSKPITIPIELKSSFDKNSELEAQFDLLSKTNRRDFAEHIGGAKREETRIRRLQKCIPMIMNGIELNDKYKK